MIDPEQLNDLQAAGVAAGFAGLCGALSHLLKVEEGKPFRWREFALHTAVSAVAGLITYHLLVSVGTPVQLSSALCGVAGWMGTTAMKLLELLLLRRTGVDPKVVKSIKEGEEKNE